MEIRMTVKQMLLPIVMLVIFTSVSCNNPSTENTNNPSARTDSTSITVKDTVINKPDTNSNSTSVSADWLLIPGVSAGQTRLNEDADSVYQRLGTPDGNDAAMMKAVAIWYAHHDTTGNSIAIYTSTNTDTPIVARIKQIRVTSPVFKTADGIHTTSSLQEIKNHFPVQQTETYKDAGAGYAVYDSKQGIAFEINPDSVCAAIVIHKAGVINEGTYLKFRTTNKHINH
jgi:hypothetical protein